MSFPIKNNSLLQPNYNLITTLLQFKIVTCNCKYCCKSLIHRVVTIVTIKSLLQSNYNTLCLYKPLIHRVVTIVTTITISYIYYLCCNKK